MRKMRRACSYSFAEAKRCNRGKPCSATCISREDDCISELHPVAQKALKKLSARLVKKEGDAALNEAQAEALGEGLLSLYNNSVTGKAKTGQALYPPEVAKRYEDFQTSGKLEVTPIRVTKKELDDIWSSLSDKTKNDLKAKGKPPAGVPRDEQRGKMILRKLIETGFRDEITGQPYSWRELQPDHKRPLSAYTAANRAKADRYDNIVMTHAGYNGLKGNIERRAAAQKLRGKEAEKFTAERLKQEYGKQASRTREEFDREVNKKASVASARKELNRQLQENSKLWTRSQWASNLADLKTPEVKALLSSVSDEGGPSGKFKVQNRSRGGEYYPPSLAVGKAALLLNKGVPTSEWPPGLLKESTKALKADLTGRTKRGRLEKQEGYDKLYASRFKDFAGTVPPEFQSILDKYS